MNIVDSILKSVSPSTYLKRVATRKVISAIEGNSSRKTKRSKGSKGLETESNEYANLEALRDKSRKLFKYNTTARGAILNKVTNEIGTGLHLNAQIDASILGISEEEKDQWEERVEMCFDLWAKSKNVDVRRISNFYELTDLISLSHLIDGDAFALFPKVQRTGDISPVKVQLIEASRCSNPNYGMDSKTIAGGVEVDKYGAPIAYHFSTSQDSYGAVKSWKRVEAYGKKTGQVNVAHVFKPSAPGDRRAYPWITPIIKSLKTLGDYQEAELAAAAVSALFTVFVKNDTGKVTDTISDYPGRERVTVTNEEEDDNDTKNLHLGTGAVVGLADGETIETANPSRPNQGYKSFIDAVLREIGMSLNIPFEVLVKHFTSSYTAARAALQEAYKEYKRGRSFIANAFCQVVYEHWLTWEIYSGRINAPGFFSDPLKKAAWLNAAWIGPSVGSLDPLKEAKASKLLIDNILSNHSRESIAIHGEDWNKILKRYMVEHKKIASITPEKEVVNV
ncbi:phage portal protein [Spirochaeta cellobiosiphila]|uniref:phage portal protein n=1 Tax=Spirochaeta cellobiosiphila TaxID=504483 RepID=UPI00040F22BB|nr:phage portal protein [Spirochaeta cellobiosiphila]